MRSRPAPATAALALTAIALTAVGAAAPALAGAPSDLVISEYVEGTSNNKAIELFNGTSTAVDLEGNGYTIQMYFNGSATAGLTIGLTGDVAPGDVFVLAHSLATPSILAQADQTNGAGFFNGDDAIVLRRGGPSGSIVDSIGQVGVDPGAEWGSGLTSTADNTLRRPSTVESGDTDPADAFDPAVSWTGWPTDTFDGIGAHPGVIVPPDPPTVTVGEVQGQTLDSENPRTDRSPFAPAAGNGSNATFVDARGVITQRTLARTNAGAEQFGFFLQSRRDATDGDPRTSDGIFVFMGGFTSLIGGYVPVVGDEVVVRARVSEFFFLTQLTSASLVRVLATGVTDVAVDDAVPPADLAAADRFWERHEGAQLRVRAGSVATSGRDVFASTADAEAWLVDVDDPILDRPDPFTRRVFRDAHPTDGVPDGNGNRIMLGSLGRKWTVGDSTALLPPVRLFDTLVADTSGGLYFAFDKYGIQAPDPVFAAGIDPSTNNPPRPADRRRELAVATYNVENLYDFRDDPFDGCDFVGNLGCLPAVRPPFDYAPASEAVYRAHLETIASQIVTALHSPDLLLVQEAEDQDICAVVAGTLACGATDDADGKPDTLQDLALAIAAAGGPTYDAGYDRDGADDRGIVSAFLYRTDRLSLMAPTSVLTATPGVGYRSEGLPYNADIQNPKVLNAILPSDVDRSTGVDGSDVYTRAPQVARFLVRSGPGAAEGYPLWAVSNHFSSTPQARVGQRREQAAYGAAIVAAIEAGAGAAERVVYGGDLNVFPRPDDPLNPPSDQLGPLYDKGLRNLWTDLAEDSPASAYSYVFQGQGQTLDHLWANPALYGDLIQIRAAHVNAGWPADHDGDGARGASDHDPQVALFRSRPRLSVADASVLEGNSGVTPMAVTATVSRALSVDVVVCALVIDVTTRFGSDHNGPLLSCATLAAGATTLVFAIRVNGDGKREGDERLAVLVLADLRVDPADPLAIGVIVDDD